MATVTAEQVKEYHQRVLGVSMATYTKHVFQRELEFHEIAAAAGLAPRIVGSHKTGIRFYEPQSGEKEELVLMSVEYWPVSLARVPPADRGTYLEQGLAQLSLLHDNGIFHCDLYPENIVVNPFTGEVRFINFSQAQGKDELTCEDMVERYTESDVLSMKECT